MTDETVTDAKTRTRTVWKYESDTFEFDLELPVVHRFLDWQITHEGRNVTMTVWFEVVPHTPHDPPGHRLVTRWRATVVGTGHTIPQRAEWLATRQDPPFVWHLYRLQEPTPEFHNDD